MIGEIVGDRELVFPVFLVFINCKEYSLNFSGGEA